MNLWIRSTNKRLLSNGDIGIFITYNTVYGRNDICMNVSSNSDTRYTMGSYSTEEKAIKALDMIEKHIEQQDALFDEIISTQRIKVFQMPLENEIEL